MRKKSLSTQAREHARYLLDLADDLQEAGATATAQDCRQSSAIIAMLLHRLDSLNEPLGRMNRILMGRE